MKNLIKQEIYNVLVIKEGFPCVTPAPNQVEDKLRRESRKSSKNGFPPSRAIAQQSWIKMRRRCEWQKNIHDLKTEVRKAIMKQYGKEHPPHPPPSI